MRNIFLSLAALSTIVGFAVAAEPAGVSEVPVPKASAVPLQSESFFDVWIKDRLSIGLGVSFSTLTDSKRPKDVENGRTFVGFVWKLEDTDQVGIVPELRYWASDYVRLVLSMDRVVGRTRNYNQMKHSDGEINVWGPQFLVEGLYPLCDNTVFLHAGAGVVYEFSDFTEDKWWKLGYASRDSWVYYGGTDKARQGYYREIHVDDGFGWILSAGCSWRPHPRFELDLSLRHTWFNPDCQFGYNYGKRKGFEKHQDGDFDLDHLSVALTASYVF